MLSRPSMPNLSLRLAREAQGWTQEALAEQLGTNAFTVSRWERGEARPSPYFRQKLVAFLGKSAVELGLLKAPPERPSPPPGMRVLLPPAAPPDVPALWTVPYPRNPHFTGREELLDHLEQRLSSGIPQALTGLGGIGKTHLATEYAYRFRHKYQAVFWLRAETRELLMADLTTLAGELGLDEPEVRDQARLLRAIQQWLRAHPGWLLILDNVEDVTVLADFFPDTAGGALLLTTRPSMTGPLAHALELDDLVPEEGALLLLRRAKLLGPTASLQEATDSERGEAQQVAALLGGLPLALDQAGAYIEETKCSLAEYFCLFQAMPMQLLQKSDPYSGHRLSVVQTFTLAFERIQKSNPTAREVLLLCSFLAPDSIPEELITSGAGPLDAGGVSLGSEPLLFQQALRDLLGYSLVRRNPKTKTVSLHRLVQAVVRDQLSQETQRLWASRVVHLVNRVFPDAAVPENWPGCHTYLPHTEACARWIQQWSLSSPEAGQLLLKSAAYLRELAHYPRAEALLNEAQAIYQRRLALDHPEMISLWYLQAKLANDQRNYAQAETLCRQALQLGEQVLGPEDVQSVRSLVLLASVLADRGEHAQAEGYYRQALQQYQRLLGPAHSDLAMTLNDLALSVREQGRYAEAEALFLQARAMYEHLLGGEHVQVALTIDNLAALYVRWGRHAEAEPLLHQALSIRKQMLAADHPHIAYSLGALAHLYLAQGVYAQAEELLQQSLAIHTRLFGEEAGDVAIDLNDLAVTSMELGHYDQAESLARRALAIMEHVFGVEHPYVATVLNNLALLYLHQDRAGEAELYSQRALDIMEQAFGRNHPRTAFHLTTSARIALEQKRYPQAEARFHEAIRIQEQVLGKNHRYLAQSCTGLATLYSQQGALVQAESLYQRALSIWATVSSEHPDVAYALHGLAKLALEQHQYQEAESFYTRALGTREHRLGPNHPLTAETVQSLATLYREQRKYGTALSLYQRALVIRQQTFGPTHPRTLETLQQAAKLFREGGQNEQALIVRQAMGVQQDLLDGAFPEIAEPLATLAALSLRLGPTAEAEQHLQQAQAIWNQAVGPDFRPLVAWWKRAIKPRSERHQATSVRKPSARTTGASARALAERQMATQCAEIHPVQCFPAVSKPDVSGRSAQRSAALEVLEPPLSQREQEILVLLAAGCSNREIAEALVVTVNTVKWHLKVLYSKLQVHSRTHAIAQAHIRMRPSPDSESMGTTHG